MEHDLSEYHRYPLYASHVWFQNHTESRVVEAKKPIQPIRLDFSVFLILLTADNHIVPFADKNKMQGVGFLFQ